MEDSLREMKEFIRDHEVGGVKFLWALVLVTAYEDAIEVNSSTDQRDTASARAWIMNNDHKNFNSFLNICQIFDLDPSKIRKQMISKIYDVNKKPYWRTIHRK